MTRLVEFTVRPFAGLALAFALALNSCSPHETTEGSETDPGNSVALSTQSIFTASLGCDGIVSGQANYIRLDRECFGWYHSVVQQADLAIL
jgi:hypothetical protein